MNKIRIGIIGAGNISKFHVRGHQANSDLIEIAAVCDIVKERAEAAAKDWGAKKIYTDYAKLAKDPDIDAVDICTPHNMHAAPAVAAAEAGKHVLLEKPIAMNVDECDEMIRAARKSEIILMPAVNYLFYPPVVKLKELIDAGVLGEPLTCVCHLRENGDWHTKTWFASKNWKGQPEISGGGVLFDYAYHDLYTARWLMGEFEKVTAMVDKRTDLPSKPYLIDDINMIIWKFKGVQKYGMAEVDMFGPIGRDQRFEITGTKCVGLITGRMGEAKAAAGGTMHGRYMGGCVRGGNTLSPLIVYNEEETHYYLDSDSALEASSDVTSTESARGMTRHWAECILQNRQPKFTAEDGKRAIEIVRAIYKSSETGRTITLS
jgi:predicted dehydrogenase